MWVLIVLLSTVNPATHEHETVGGFSQEFKTQEACRAAAQDIKEASYYKQANAWCTKK